MRLAFGSAEASRCENRPSPANHIELGPGPPSGAVGKPEQGVPCTATQSPKMSYLLERHLVSSQHNEANAAVDGPPGADGHAAADEHAAVDGSAAVPAAAGQAEPARAQAEPAAAEAEPARMHAEPARVQADRPSPTMTGPAGPTPAGPSSAGPSRAGSTPFNRADLPATGRPAFGGPLPGTKSPWKEGNDGRTVFRRVPPIVLWWVWVVFALFNVIQVIIPDHDYFSVEFAVGLLAVTGVVYATALRPKVFATPDGIEVQNPVRDHVIRWGALNGVYLGDAVELSCARPTPRNDQTIYCWALYSRRRSRMKSQQLGVRSWSRVSPRGATATEPTVHDPAQLIAAELGRRSTQAREVGASAATLESRWAWQPIALIVVPAAALLALLLAR